jgi:hypothetical protein
MDVSNGPKAMDQPPSSGAVQTSFVKAFAGIYGSLDRDAHIKSGKIDLHDIVARRIGDHQLYLIGTNGSPSPFSWPFLNEWLAVKGRPFWMTESAVDGSRGLDDLLTELDGKFSLCGASAEGLWLATDLIGAGAVYYAQRGRRLYYATHLGLLLWLLDETPECNLLGAVSVLICRAQIERETHFRNIFRLGPGQRLLASRPGEELALNVTQYASIPEVLSRNVDPGSGDPNMFGELLRASHMRENYPAGSVLMLTAGRDSKALALAKPDRDYIAVTYGTSDCRDKRHARLVAAALEVEHRQVPYEEWTYGTYAPQFIGLGAGSAGLADAHNVVGFHWARQLSGLSIAGYLGGPVTGWAAKSDEAQTLRHRKYLLFPNLTAKDVDFHSTFPNEVGHLLETERKEQAALSGLSVTQISMVRDWSVRQSWLSLMFDFCEWYTDLALPFYYRPLMKFIFNRPFAELRNQTLYDQWSGAAMAGRSGFQGLSLRQKIDDLRAITFSLARAGRLPKHRISWSDVTERSRRWLEQTIAECPGLFGDLTRRSYAFTLRTGGDDKRMPTFLLSIPLALATERRWRAESMIRS